MKNLTTFVADKEIEIIYVNALTSGYGHKNIIAEVRYNGESKEFHATTSNMPGYDAATDLEGIDKDHALYELIESQIIDEIAYWLECVDEVDH